MFLGLSKDRWLRVGRTLVQALIPALILFINNLAPVVESLESPALVPLLMAGLTTLVSLLHNLSDQRSAK